MSNECQLILCHIFGKWNWVTNTCVNFNQMILERNWMLSIAVAFITVANTAFVFCECERNIFKNMFMCKFQVLLEECPIYLKIIFHVLIFALIVVICTLVLHCFRLEVNLFL